jgi:hypothetical protein
VLCRRDNAPPAPRSKLHRSLILAGVLTTLFGGAAFARGVVASRAARVAPPQPVFETHEPPPAPHAGPPPAATAEKAPEPVATPVPSTTTNHRLDDAIATIPTAQQPAPKPEPVATAVETPAEAPCVCRPRVAHLGQGQPYNAWGPDHDSDGHLHTKSRLHSAWGPPLSFNEPSTCRCPRGTVRVRPHPQMQNGSTTDHLTPE